MSTPAKPDEKEAPKIEPIMNVTEAFTRKIGNPADTDLWHSDRFRDFERQFCVSRLMTWIAHYDFSQTVWSHSPGALHTMLDASLGLCGDFFPGKKGSVPAIAAMNSWAEVIAASKDVAPAILQRTLPVSMYWNLSKIATGDPDSDLFVNGRTSDRDKAVYGAMCCLMAEGKLSSEVESGRQLALFRAINSDLPEIKAFAAQHELYQMVDAAALAGNSAPVVKAVLEAAAAITETSSEPITLPIVNNLREFERVSFNRRPDEDAIAFIQRTPWGQHIYAKGIKPYANTYNIPKEELLGEAMRAAVEGYSYFVPIVLEEYTVRDAKTMDKNLKTAAEAVHVQLDLLAPDESQPEKGKSAKGYTTFICPAPSGSFEAQMKYRLGEVVEQTKSAGMANNLQNHPDVVALRKDAARLQKQDSNLDWEECVTAALSVMNAGRQEEALEAARKSLEAASKAMPSFKAAKRGMTKLQGELHERATLLHHRATGSNAAPNDEQWLVFKREAANQMLSEAPVCALNPELARFVYDGAPGMVSLDASVSGDGDRTAHEMIAGDYEANVDDLEPTGLDDSLSRISSGCRTTFGFGDEPDDAPRSRVLQSIEAEARQLKDNDMLRFLRNITSEFKTYPSQRKVEEMLSLVEDNYKVGENEDDLQFLRRGTHTIRTVLQLAPVMLIDTVKPLWKELAEVTDPHATFDQNFRHVLGAAAQHVTANPEVTADLMGKMQKSI